MCKNNEPEARVLAFKCVPYSDAEDVVGAVIARLVDNETLEAVESELDGVVENLRDALVGAIEETLDLRADLLAMCDTAEDLSDLVYAIRYRLERDR